MPGIVFYSKRFRIFANVTEFEKNYVQRVRLESKGVNCKFIINGYCMPASSLAFLNRAVVSPADAARAITFTDGELTSKLKDESLNIAKALIKPVLGVVE